MKKIILICSMAFFCVCAQAAKPNNAAKKSKGKTVVVDSTKNKPEKGSFESVIKPGAKISKGGMFTIIEQDGKYYFYMPKNLLERDILVVNRLSKAAAGIRAGFAGYAGDEIQEAMVRFVQSPDEKNIFLQNVITKEIPRDSVGQMREAVLRSNFQPIAEAFKIEATSKGGDSILIDATNYINSDNSLVGFDNGVKQVMNLSSFQKDKSYVVWAKSYPINVELRSVKTYMYTPKYGTRTMPAEPASFEVNSSMVLLPAVPMRPRYDDRRVGYFTDNYVDYEKNPQGIKNVSMISRFRLEPKPEDIEAYKRGELVEPAKPIIYYIDPTTPQKWIPYLIQGVNDWQVAFEAAGFKNAIIGKEAPTKDQDSTWSLEDARYCAIVYKPSDIPNASGPHVSDPRSGESIETHINWYHNVQLLLRNWYMLQAGPNDPKARQMEFPEELMGQLIRFVSSHEVGHTLGLRHNMGATSAVPVDSLRSREYLSKNGHTPSIMDYSRFNYVVQPEDGIEPQLQYPRISDYDIWAIEFGYRYLPQFKNADEEASFLNQWVIEKNRNPRLWFGHEMNPSDPRSQTEDLGDNQMKANALGIKNLKLVMAALPEWTKQPNQNYASLKDMYGQVLNQYGRYVGHVTKWVGGIYENPKTIEQGGVVYTTVEKAKQEEAMRWLKEYVINNNSWLNVPDVFAKTGLSSTNIYTSVYNNLFVRLLSVRVLNNLANAEMELGTKTYTLNNLFNQLNGDVWSNTYNPDVQKRLQQSAYVGALLGSHFMILTSTSVAADAKAMVSYQMRWLLGKLKSSQTNDPVTKGLYQSLAADIENRLDPSYRASM